MVLGEDWILLTDLGVSGGYVYFLEKFKHV